MWVLLALIAPLLIYAQTPVISYIAPITSTTLTNSLLTVGGERLALWGSSFGSSVQLTYVGPSPFQNGFTVRYSPIIQSQNDTTIVFTTTPGIGANLQFSVTRLANNASTTSGPLAAYAIPTLTNITGVGSDPFALKPQGGETLRFYGRNFGPRTYPGYPWIYTPWVRFGGTAGTWAWMQGCSRTASDFDNLITCRTPVGGGTNHSVRVNTGYAGQWSIVDRNRTVSFVTPTVQGTTPTFTSMTTAGGDQIVIRGLNMPHPSWVIQGFCPVSASFGPYNYTKLLGFDYSGGDLPGMPIRISNTSSADDCAALCAQNPSCKAWTLSTCGTGPTRNCWLKGSVPTLRSNACSQTGKMAEPPFQYRMRSCTGAFDGDGRTPVLTCLSPEGTGRGYVLSVNVGGLYTNLFINRQSGYAAPVLFDFGGVSQDASTLGNETVFVNGRNFGRNASLITARYTLNLKSPINAIESYTYTSLGCNVTVPHTQLGCRTAPGVGQDLIWSITVDGQANVNPKTGYTSPKITRYEVRNATGGQVKVGASTQGGDMLFVYGSGFGPPYLNLIKEVSAVSPFGLNIPLTNYTLLRDDLVSIMLPPGGGTGWSITLKVADIANEPSIANYSYANPTVLSVSPGTGPTQGGTIITVFADDLAISNPNLITGVVFGNPSDGSVWPTVIPANLVPRPDSDNVTRTAYLPGRVTFRLPPGSGLNRYVRLVTYLDTDIPPNPIDLPTEKGANFNYVDPVITNAVLSQPVTPSQIQAALNFFGPDAVSTNQVRLLSLYGLNFGQGSYPLASRWVEYLNGTWQNNTGLYQFDPTEWTDSVVQLYTLEGIGTIRIALGSQDIFGEVWYQYSNQFAYNDFSPTLITNVSGPFPTVGGSIVTLSASYLSAAQSFNITVGSQAAAILDPTTRQPLRLNEIYTRILTNPSCYSPAGSFTPATVWTFQVQLPAGQGSQVPTTITRFPDGSQSAPIYISYSPPSLTQINGVPFDPYFRYLSPTVGSQFTLSGSNFGPCPSIQIATYIIQSCIDQPGSISEDHTLLTLRVPEGEGDGVALIGSGGWTLQIQAGDQSAPVALFGWRGPEITELQYGPVPTLGGSTLTVKGSNFGASVPGYPQASLPDNLKVNVFLNSSYLSNVCQSIQRVSHSEIDCVIPPGAGTVRVFVSVAGQISTSTQIFTYNTPSIYSLRHNNTVAANATVRAGELLVLEGADFGPTPQFSCVFFTNRYMSNLPSCNGQEDFAGEGEQEPGAISFWNHTTIEIRVPPGTGSPEVGLSVWGQYIRPATVTLVYPSPSLLNISRLSGPSSGGYGVQLAVSNVGFAPIQGPYPRPLPSYYYSPIRILMNGLCLSYLAVTGCQQAITTYQDTSISFTMPEGIGLNYNFTVIVDDPMYMFASNSKMLWSYDPPSISQFNPNPVYIGSTLSPTVVIQGENLGTPAAFSNFPTTERSVSVFLDSIPQSEAKRFSTDNLLVGIEFKVDGTQMTAGRKQTDLVIAGQRGIISNTSFSALRIFCERGYFAKERELCLECPVGGTCPGSLLYPNSVAGFFNLNSSYQNAELCPASAVITNPDGLARDLCLVACSPTEACVGGNLCAEGYRSVAPAYRCNVCDKGFYKRANECIRCPDSPIAVIIGCVLIVIALAGIGFFLNKKQVNMAFLSIAIDYFQVISIFLQSKIAWPPAIKNLMYILSAFNLNLDIVAPECLVPDISYAQKFYFIQALPISLFGFLFLVNIGYMLYKSCILGRTRKELMKHTSSLKASALIVMYFLYLYTTRTLFDVFNCAPTIPPTYDSNGVIIKYLSVQFEQCGKPGGLQEQLMPVAVLGIFFYSVGFPLFTALIMLRQKLNIVCDQLLRAQGEGDSRFENPVAYQTRKAYGRLYYQYKPDYFYWSLAILARKFCIAVTSVLFTANASFQMAACLLVLFISYAAQTRFNPFMCYSDYDEVIRNHLASLSTSRVHMRAHAIIVTSEAKNRVDKKRYKNTIVSSSGRIDKTELFKAIGGWIFNYNTVEAIMLFSGVIVCLMGIMYQSQNIVSGYDNGGKDAITGVILFVIIASIFYLFSVFCIEIYLTMANHVQVKRSKPSGPSTKKLKINNKFEMKALTETNPMMLKNKGPKQINLDEYDEPPPPALWAVFKDMFKENGETIKQLNQTISELKREQQHKNIGGIELSPFRMVKREVGPGGSISQPPQES